MQEYFSMLVNLLWKECIQNLNATLTEKERSKFSNNDYYYLLTIQSLERPNFSQIAEKLALTKPAVSVIIRKLISMELVHKIQSATDKRIYHVELTEKGNRILQGDTAVYKYVSDNIKDLAKNQKELEVVERIIFELVKRLENKSKLIISCGKS